MKKISGLKTGIGTLAVTGLMASSASAAIIVGITDMVMNPDDGTFSGTTNQTFQDYQESTDGSGWYNGSGLQSALTDGMTVPGTLPLHQYGQNVGDLAGPPATPAFESSRIRSGGVISASTTLTFELSGATDDLNGILLWNHTEGGGQSYRGFKSVTVSFSTDGTNFNVLGTESVSFTQAASTGTNGAYSVAGEFVDFGGDTYDNVTHVRFSDITKFTDKATSGDGADLYSLAEVRFTAVPEPSAALLGSLGLLGLLRRRRRY